MMYFITYFFISLIMFLGYAILVPPEAQEGDYREDFPWFQTGMMVAILWPMIIMLLLVMIPFVGIVRLAKWYHSRKK